MAGFIEEKVTTEYIKQRLDDVFDQEEELYMLIEGKKVQEIENQLLFLVKNRPTFGEYIYRYIFERDYSKKPEYREKNYWDIEESEYKQIIRRSFKENGMSGKASLCEETREPLRYDDLEKSSIKVRRERAFLYAFALDMNLESTSWLLKNALLQQDFNFRDYQEVLFYWCIKTQKNNRYERLQCLLEKYKSIKEKRSEKKSEKSTEMLVNRVERISSEDELFQYLGELEASDERDVTSRTVRRLYKELVKLLPRRDEENEEKSEKNIGIRQTEWVADNLKAIAESAQKKYPENKVLDRDVLEQIFTQKIWTREMLENRQYEHASREDILIAEFMINSVCLREQGSEGEEASKVTIVEGKDGVEEFHGEIALTLEECRMRPLYLRNPFELFLIYCLLQENPFEYFMASWALVR